MKKHIMIFICIFFLFGCSSAKQTEVICKGMMNGSQVTTRLQASGDDINIETYEEISDLSKQGYDPSLYNETQKQEIISLLCSKKYDLSKFKNIPGIDFQANLDGNHLIMRLQIDYQTASPTDLEAIHVIEDSNIFNLGISLEKTVEGYEQSGLVCQ